MEAVNKLKVEIQVQVLVPFLRNVVKLSAKM